MSSGEGYSVQRRLVANGNLTLYKNYMQKQRQGSTYRMRLKQKLRRTNKWQCNCFISKTKQTKQKNHIDPVVADVNFKLSLKLE